MDAIPPPDRAEAPAGFTVAVDSADQIHFLDWATDPPVEGAGVLLIHGLSNTAWIWTPVARRLHRNRHVIAMDLRGHGLSDAPTDGYDPATLVGDVSAVAEASGLLATADDRIVLAGHGFGAIVAAWTAAALGPRCAGLVLVDGGWESLEHASGVDVDEFLRGLDEPPEVMRSMTAFLADRAAFDPPTWDADQEQAARSTIVETRAGRVVPATRPHALEACVRVMFDYDPDVVVPSIVAPVAALLAADDETGSRAAALASVSAARVAAGQSPIRTTSFGHDGHNLMRYRPEAVSTAILDIADEARD